MPQENDNSIKAELFFKRAEDVALSSNFDYAIELYLDGLRSNPDALQEGHLRLRELALARQVKGGKKPSIVERVRFLRGKTPLERMLNAEYLLAKDPDHLPYAEAMLKAVIEADYKQTAKWVADLLFAASNASQSPSVNSYLLLKDSYVAIGEWERAIAACQYAAKLRPNDAEIGDEVQRLTAEFTVSRGKYDQEGDFRKSIKNREAQEKLQSQDAVVKTEDYRVSAVESARKTFALNPESGPNIFRLANALADLQNDQADDEAVKMLGNAYVKKQDFSFRERAGLIRISQIKRKIREFKAQIETNPDDSVLKSRLSGMQSQLNKVEMEHYGLCVKNYPTNLQAKYEYGVRLIRNKRFDEAIPLLQEAQRDPRHRIAAMDKVGMCFFMKGWYADAADIFSKAIESHEIKDDDIAKELRYNLARAYEEQGEIAKALEGFRKLAQLDFGYKDVSQRVDKLRKEMQ